ncbi:MULTISPECIES: ATP-grasp domain-containing protein [Sphingomonas]|uniref:ATP-grasp domain-containing protein n=1 Tax=Sphingomonas TaxID=13687 RepID=UPI00193BAAD1|nr:RimK family alpha-L-glutamate ligase [Sphingomonas sp.]
MQGWILFFHDLEPGIPEVPEILRFREAAGQLGIALAVYKPQLFDLIVGGGHDDWSLRYDGLPVQRPDFVLCRTGAETDYSTLALLRQLERRGVRLINGATTIELVADKLHTMQKLARVGLPVPRTMLGRFPFDAALVERELGFPVIVKTLQGTRGAGVLKCEDRAQFEDLAGLLESARAQADFVLQHYIRASHGRDVRILVVGGRVVAAMERRSLTGGFKSNVSLGGIGTAYNPPPEMADIAIKAAAALDLDVTGIDILFDETGYRICEANSAPGFQGLERASGADIPAIILSWIRDTQDRAPGTPSARAEEGAIVDLVFAGRSRLDQLVDTSASYDRFAIAIGWRLIGAGLSALGHATLPRILIDRRGGRGRLLRGLYEDRAVPVQQLLEQDEQERTLISVLAVAVWAAIMPWLAGAESMISGMLSLVALLFPATFLLTAPAGRARRLLQKPGAEA